MAGGVSDLHAVGGMGAGSVPQRRLVPMLARLKWTLWKRSFRKNIGRVIGTAFGVLYGIGGLVGLTLALGGAALLADGAGPDAFGLLMRVLGAVVIVVWLVVPLFAFGLDDTLDPRRFATLPRAARELQPGLLTAALISLPSLFTLVGVLIATACEVLWLLTSRVPDVPHLIGALVLVLPGNLLGIVLCVLLPRAILAQSSTRQTSRRARELGAVGGMVVMLAVLYGVSLLGQEVGRGIDPDALVRGARTAVGVLAWTPFGAAFSAPLDVAEGHALVGIARLLIGGAGVVAVWLWWRRSITLALRSALVGDSASGTAKVTSLVPRFLPAGALGAAVGRSLRYWRRDSRYLGAIAVLPVVLVFMVVMGLLNGDDGGAAITPLLGVVLVAGLSGITIANELGYDGPAGWVHLTAGMNPRANLLGRVLALATFTIPIVLVVAVVVPLMYGVPELIGMLAAGAIGAMLSAWGVAMLMSVLLPYPAAAPGTNPMRNRSSGSANTVLSSFGATLGMWVPQLPAIALAVVGLVLGSTALDLLAGLVSVICGAVTLALCLRGASRILERHYVDLFQRVRSFT